LLGQVSNRLSTSHPLLNVFRPEVVIAGRETKILIDQVRIIDVSYVAGDLVDCLPRDDMAQVEHSLSRYFGLLR
jgi:mRNA interferase MazF